MESAKAQSKQKAAAKAKKAPLAHGVGRRKSAVARVWLRRGAGKVLVNGKEYSTYFDTDIMRAAVITPFNVVPKAATYYDADVNVQGGGLCAQADAVKLGLSRALFAANEELKPLLRQNGLLTVDARVKERKKYGRRAARRRFQFVKR